MMFKGDCLRLDRLEGGLVELCFDRASGSINKLDDKAVAEFDRAVREIAADDATLGVLVTSAKDVFIVGADITEFGRKFRCSGEEVARDVLAANQIFVRFEDLPVPTVVAINGFALGGGLELALCAAQRVISAEAQVGLPEVNLGLFPGFGGTVRLSRAASQRVALEWIVSGRPATAAEALRAGVVDAVVAPERVRAEALARLVRCVQGQVDWRAAQQRKREPVAMLEGPAYDDMLVRLAGQAARHQPAAEMAVHMMREAAVCDRQRALELEASAFGAVTQTQAASAMVQSFLNEQAVRKLARRHAEGGLAVSAAAVIGSGITGDGISRAAMRKNMPVRTHDLDPTQLEAAWFADVHLVVEAAIEDLSAKQQVMAQVQSVLKPGTVLASTTSCLRVDDIAAPLPRPQDVVGLHFFTPDLEHPLVEVVRASRTSDAAVATAAAYVNALGKTPIVVKDGPGFLVNRILAPCVIAFCDLVAEGADPGQITRALESFGWCTAPAPLDGAGVGSGDRVLDAICAGYPQRLKRPARDAAGPLYGKPCLAQGSGAGTDKRDAPNVERIMLPMLLEAIRCLEEGVVGSAAELDFAMLRGAGFPTYLGGPLKYADWIGLPQLLARCNALAAHGPMHAAPALLRKLAASNGKFHAVA